MVLPCAGEACHLKTLKTGSPSFQVLRDFKSNVIETNLALWDVILEPAKFFKCWIMISWFFVLLSTHSFGWQGLYALNTVRAVYESLPPGLLQEIIVVDDGTEPPLAQSFLTPEVLEKFQVTILRHVTWLLFWFILFEAHQQLVLIIILSLVSKLFQWFKAHLARQAESVGRCVTEAETVGLIGAKKEQLQKVMNFGCFH